MNTKELLENISTDCLGQLTKYKYNKNLDISSKYKKGKIAALQYTLDLIYHFYEKDKELKKDFETTIAKQIEDMNILKDGDYKQALIETLSWAKKRLDKN